MARRMKDSGVAWIGQVPAGWSVERIASLYNVRNEKCSDKEYGALSVTMQGVVPQLEDVAKTDDGDNRKLVRIGDFVINSRSDRRGACGISQYDGSVSLINTVLRPFGIMNSGYYSWLFRSFAFADEFYANGHGIVDDLWTTRWQDMKRIKVPSPSLAEQKQIAEFLDRECGKLDALAEKVKAQIAQLEACKKSIITEAVTPKEGWEVKRLKYLVTITTGDHDTQDADPDGEYNFYVRSPIIEKSKDYTFEGPGILMAGDGAGAGRIFHIADGKYAVHQRVYRMYDFNNVNIKYLWYFLGSSFPQRMDMGSAQSTVPSVRLPMLLNHQIPCPPLAEQKKIADWLDEKCGKVDEIIKQRKAQLEKLAEYKKSLIYEYVTGKKEVSA